MTIEASRHFAPDYICLNGQLVGWEEHLESGDTLLLQKIIEPTTFCTRVVSPGHPEIISLFDPRPGQILRVTHIDERGRPKPRDSIVLDINEPSMALRRADRAIMDATETTALGALAYTCLLKGVRRFNT